LTTNGTTFTIVDAFLCVGVVLDVELSAGVACKRFRVTSIGFSRYFNATGYAFWLLLFTFCVVDTNFFFARVCRLSLSWSFFAFCCESLLIREATVLFAVGRRDVGCACDAGFVTFPSDARSLLR